MSKTIATHNEQETEQLGAQLAQLIVPGLAIGLSGTLGAGKTRLVKSIAMAKGVEPTDIGSPTFSLAKVYRCKSMALVHIDLFRINDSDEYFELGIDEQIEIGNVVLIEWAERFAEWLPIDILKVEISVIGEEARQFDFAASGELAESVLSELSEKNSALPARDS